MNINFLLNKNFFILDFINKDLKKKNIKKSSINKSEPSIKNVYYEPASKTYINNSPYIKLTFDILFDAFKDNFKNLEELKKSVKETPKDIPENSTVVYILYLLGPRFSSPEKKKRLGLLIDSNVNLVIILFRVAPKGIGSGPLEPLKLEIHPPDVKRIHPLEFIEFMVSMQGQLLKENNFFKHYTDSINELKKRIL